jgi:hypothetical protein
MDFDPDCCGTFIPIEPPEPQVIHGGVLMPAAKAWVEMMQEFPQAGFSEGRIREILAKAVAGTQRLLHEIADLPEEQGAIRLEWALRADAAAAARWRSQWSIGSQRYEDAQYHSDETHAERIKRYQRDQELQEQYREEWEAQEKERAKLHRKAVWNARVAHWHAMNESGGRDAEQQARALRRQQEDLAQENRILYRAIIEEHEDERIGWVYWRPGIFESMLLLLNDHQYIEWMFACHARGWRAPV